MWTKLAGRGPKSHPLGRAAEADPAINVDRVIEVRLVDLALAAGPFDQLADEYFNKTRRVVGQWQCRDHLPALPMRQRGTMIGNGRNRLDLDSAGMRGLGRC
jgi:hypothetical protein